MNKYLKNFLLRFLVPFIGFIVIAYIFISLLLVEPISVELKDPIAGRILKILIISSSILFSLMHGGLMSMNAKSQQVWNKLRGYEEQMNTITKESEIRELLHTLYEFKSSKECFCLPHIREVGKIISIGLSRLKIIEQLNK